MSYSLDHDKIKALNKDKDPNAFVKSKDQEEETRKKIDEDADSFNEEGEFVKMKNKDFKDILFGGKEKKNDDSDPTVNFLNGKKYSDKFYDLL
jgi:hypothetical protein